VLLVFQIEDHDNNMKKRHLDVGISFNFF
jgi:hypothetical protein